MKKITVEIPPELDWRPKIKAAIQKGVEKVAANMEQEAHDRMEQMQARYIQATRDGRMAAILQAAGVPPADFKYQEYGTSTFKGEAMSEESLALRAARDRAESYRTQLERMKEERDALKRERDDLRAMVDSDHDNRVNDIEALSMVMDERDELKRHLLDVEGWRKKMQEQRDEATAAWINHQQQRDRLQELLDSTTAQLERTQGERDELQDHLEGRVFANARQLGRKLIEVELLEIIHGLDDDVYDLKRSRHEWKRRLACTLREFKKVGDEGYDLSTWAASINRDGEGNTSEWREGLEERILRVQALTRHHPLFSSWKKVDRLMKQSTKVKP